MQVFFKASRLELLMFIIFLWVLATLFVTNPAEAEVITPSFTLHKFGDVTKPNVLIIGGIQGDEPGGFSAATLLVTNYRFFKGNVWVVPNLNFPGIIQRSRGPYGDMNRKFAELPKSDPEYTTVRRIQELIRTPGLELVLNLHDGGGFFRPNNESKECNPNRWGQSLIIDMAQMPHPQGDLEERGKKVLASANAHLLAPNHELHLKNTLTHLGNPEMEKSLSWYAVRQGVPAFGLEASKNFPVEQRVYYHLLMIEELLKQAGVSFERQFPLTPQGIRSALQDDVKVAFHNNRVSLSLENARPRLGGSIPLPKDSMDTMRASKPILAVTKNSNEITVHYGNRIVTRFKADWRETDTAISGLTMLIDGKKRRVKFGEMVTVQKSFEVLPIKNYRVNAIGADFGQDESGRTLLLRDFQTKYSLDRDSKTYRVETYRDQRIAGMILVRFGEEKQSAALPAVNGSESEMGM